MKLSNQAVAVLSWLIFIGGMWVGVPIVSRLLGLQPPWHDLRVVSLWWLAGIPLSVMLTSILQRVLGRRRP